MSADLHVYALPDTPQTRHLIDAWEAFDVVAPDDDVDEALGEISHSGWQQLAAALFGPGWSRPNLWVGQVSWAKHDLHEDPHRYIPAPVARVQALLEGGAVATPALGAALTTAFNLPNTSIYGKRGHDYAFDPTTGWGGNGPVHRFGAHRIQRINAGRGVAKRQHVKRFLRAHQGALLYPVSV